MGEVMEAVVLPLCVGLNVGFSSCDFLFSFFPLAEESDVRDVIHYTKWLRTIVVLLHCDSHSFLFSLTNLTPSRM